MTLHLICILWATLHKKITSLLLLSSIVWLRDEPMVIVLVDVKAGFERVRGAGIRMI